jgi:mono/diheme cytochrome c family protein
MIPFMNSMAQVVARVTPRRALLGATAWIFLAPAALTAAEIDFTRQILPILSENCFQCHGPDAGERQAGLRLDQKPESPDWEAMLQRIASDDPESRMPPPETGKTLNAAQISALRRWIDSGADYEAHWAFQPIRAPEPPDVGDAGVSGIDRFILSALRKRGLEFSEPLSRTQLIRRATFDLTGLPPRWGDVQAFVDDPSPNAFAKVVDRLLESPEYGERWGRHWLDLARYADTHGGSAIGFVRFPFSYTYRDYVIDAFNRDVPHDRFILEQLAADQLNLEENDPALAGLGFLTVGRQYRNRHDRLDDQIDVISRGLLGLTVACARCHDHKFDPIPTADYYSLHATLANSRKPAELPLVGSPKVSEAYAAALKARKRKRDDIVREQGAVLRGRLRSQVGLYLRELAKGTPEQDTSTTFLSYRTEDLRPVVLERWRAWLKRHDQNDPVFGLWHRLAQLDKAAFAERSRDIVQELIKQNGDPKKFAAEHRLATQPPRWNPRVLEAMAKAKPASFVEAADVYGSVFLEAHKRWLTSLLKASLEAAPGATSAPDQDPGHRVVNSAIERQLRHHLFAPDAPPSLPLEDDFHLKMLNRGVRDSVRGTLGAIDSLNRGANAPPRSMSLRELDDAPEAFVFVRGNPVNRGARVEPGFLSVLSNEEASRFPDGRRRLGLARAIADPANPLTRRVAVNWVWLHHFGRGLVRTPDDFGSRGEPPTHPGLLDYLANRLLEDDWSLKQLHRRIMLTQVYQQGSLENAAARAKDPENRLLWRMPARRLGMEAMRDALLAASGELRLSPRPGGRPFEEKGFGAIPRRSVYAFVNRDVISPLASTFDGADPSACTVKRPETMVPQQTLYALNSDYIQDRAKALAGLPDVKQAGSDQARITALYRRAYSRPPAERELQTALDYVTKASGADAAWVQLAHALLASNEFHFVD